MATSSCLTRNSLQRSRIDHSSSHGQLGCWEYLVRRTQPPPDGGISPATGAGPNLGCPVLAMASYALWSAR